MGLKDSQLDPLVIYQLFSLYKLMGLEEDLGPLRVLKVIKLKSYWAQVQLGIPKGYWTQVLE